MHDGSVVRFTKVPAGYEVANREKAFAYLQEGQRKGEVATGLLFLDERAPDMHELNRTSSVALSRLPYEALSPGAKALSEIQDEFR
jgi:2-oxoglutarate/2-oxoacid ferredoxin oxidoreductase subunit beta